MNNKILILNFSLREVSSSHKIAQYLQDLAGSKAKVCDFKDLNLPRWDEDYWKAGGKWEELLKGFRSLMDEADGYVYILPEYNGAASSLYSEFNLFVNKESNHKPVLLVGVSNGRGGAYPISQAKAFGNKNNKVNIIPEHLIVRNCEEMFNHTTKPEWVNDNDYIMSRTKFALDVLDIYTTASLEIRKSISFEPKFANGL
jgi:azobenzene reductase